MTTAYGHGGAARDVRHRDERHALLSPAQLFNGYVGTNLAFALDQSGVLALLSSKAGSTLSHLADAARVDGRRLTPVVEAAVRLGLVAEQDGRFTLTPTGSDLAAEIGYFIWAVGGYRELFGNLAGWMRGDQDFGVTIDRDPVMVALGAAKVDASLMTAILFDVLDEVEFRFIADLGCGNAARLVSVCDRYAEVSGMGVEISDGACQAARQRVVDAGMQDRISIHHADVTRFEDASERRELVDLVASFLLLHDLLAASDPPEALFTSLRRAFPNARRYLLADTNRMPSTVGEPPIFSVGFELMHGVMATPIRTTEEYEHIFKEAGLSLRRRVPFATPYTWLYLLEAR